MGYISIRKGIPNPSLVTPLITDHNINKQTTPKNKVDKIP
jgi:hypothetical protein